jgi:glutamate-5-semialdehyde dehydrogenase
MSDLMEKAKRVQAAASRIAIQTTEEKNRALKEISAKLIEEKAYILRENEKDLEAGRKNGLSEPLIDRLQLTEQRIEDMAQALIELTDLKDPIGEVLDAWERPNGLQIQQVRVPLGVIGMIYEARPNVTVDATSLCLKTGNAVLLRGSSTAIHSNKAIVHVIHMALGNTSIPADAVLLLEDTSRETASQMFKLNEYLDVLIPRGGASLIKSVVESASVPVLETGVGNCHIFIDESADEKMGIDIAVNAKTQRPSVCNACETILVQKDWAERHLQKLIDALLQKDVKIYADKKAQEMASTVTLEAATEKDWETEYLDLAVALKMVDDVHEAISHINQYGTKHSEAIISENQRHVDAFFSQVDAAALYHNASTRFTDGFEFGFGAEIGISTQKLHARGPMGLPALTSTKYIVRGTGQMK